jgi:hypothetical protein
VIAGFSLLGAALSILNLEGNTEPRSRLGNIGGHVRRVKGGADVVQFKPRNPANPQFIGNPEQFSQFIKPTLLKLLNFH